jgi:hypothetical protein
MIRIQLAGMLALVAIGCTEAVENTNEAPGTKGAAALPDEPFGYSDPSETPLACADDLTNGATIFQLPMGTGAVGMQSGVSVDQFGNIIAAKDDINPVDFYGVVKWPASFGTPGGGGFIYHIHYATIATMDRDGNTYVTREFSEPLDLGRGVMMPEGNVDVFVAKLDPDGRVLFSVPLHLCGDGVSHIAVDASGRIAVSGSAMGTVVLDAHGHQEFVFPYEGDIAFDSQGNLVVAGTITGSAYFGAGHYVTADAAGDGFVIKLDTEGHYVWSHVFGNATSAGGQSATAVAIDANDNIGVVGVFDTDIDVFGEQREVIASSEGMTLTGMFAVKLDSAGDVVFQHTNVGYAAIHDVTFDIFGNMIFSGDYQVFTSAPSIQAFVASFTESGVQSFGWQIGAYPGSGSSLGTDACGNVWWWFSLDQQHPLGLWQAMLQKTAHPGKP